MLKIIVENVIYSSVKKSNIAIIKPALQAIYKKAKYDPATRKSIYVDHLENLITSKGIFLTGYLPRLKKYLKEKNIDYEIENHAERLKQISQPSIKNKTLRGDQQRLVDQAIKNQRGILIAPTGCLTGDTMIRINRAGKGFEISLRDLYLRHNGISKRFISSIQTQVRSFNGESIQLQFISDVVYSGKKLTYKVTLQSGASICATANHKFLTTRGWVELRHLSLDDEIICDTLKSTKLYTKKIKYRDNRKFDLWHHPYAITIHSKGKKKYVREYTKTMETYRCAYEANLNNLSMNEYLNIVRHDKGKSLQLKYINPKIFHIHHKNGNHHNDDIDNLECILIADHKKEHAHKTKFNFNQGRPRPCKIKKIERNGFADTYDICCPIYHNFVANNMVVHNSGKTLLAGAIISCFPKKKALFLCDKKSLAYQAAEDFKEYGLKNITLVGDGNKDTSGDIVVAIQKSLIGLNLKSLSTQFDIIVLDESHHCASKDSQHAEILRSLLAPIRIGLTATYPSDQRVQLVMEGLLGPIVGELTEQEAKEKNIIADTKVIIRKVEFDSTVADTKSYHRAREIGIISNQGYNRQVIKEALSWTRQGKAVLISFVETEHGKLLKSIADELGLECELLYGETATEKREKVKTAFKTKKILCVIASTIWREGINVPALDVVVNASGGKSEIAIRQLKGRGTRKHEGKEMLYFIDFFNPNHESFIRHFGFRICMYYSLQWM